MDAELSSTDGSMDVDSDTEQPSSWREYRGPSAIVLETFDEWSDHVYLYYFHQLACHPDKQLTLEQLDKKVDVLRNLRTVLLPSIKHQLAAVLQSLDLSEGPAYPCPNPELTAKNLSELYDTWRNTISAADNLALDPPLPIHDGRLQDFKRFRISSLQKKIDCSIREKLHVLLCECYSWIWAWDSQEDTTDRKFQTRSADTQNRISTLVVNFGVRIDEVIAWSKLSDFAILQEECQKSTQECNKMLEDLCQILNEKPVWRKTVGQNERPDNQEKRETRKARALQLAQLGIPVVKLTRIFYGKLTNTETSDQLTFTLDPEICTIEHDSLREKISTFHHKINCIRNYLMAIYGTKKYMSANIQSLRQLTLECTESLDQVLLALAVNLFPLDAAADRSALQRDFKAFFIPLQQHFCVAATNLRDAANSCFGAVEGSQSDSSESDEVDDSESEEVEDSEGDEVEDSEDSESD
ncbi:hypothetical protein PCASD_04151 [Puccinia coronata f. sp. avenae]|uniref:Uncharacterized protein n=1 Tax=Puccinia coronata f. sp. avenae TaxID=200324 RepID=A0A2N5V8D0_9BASI|nr:hypothetical protein PCASD_04151 [Puccinia coronata f. sp. avenae]